MYTSLSMRQLADHLSALQPLPLSPANWEQIEDPEEVQQVLDDLQGKCRGQVYECAELYDLAYPGYPGDRDYYLEQGRSGRVLYLGVGTGRLFCPLARTNPQAVGIDLSGPMLARLRAKCPDLKPGQLLQGDAATAPLPAEQFDTVLAPYSFLQVIPPDRLPQLLANVRQTLVPSGRFCTDTFSPYLIPFRRAGLETNVRQVRPDTRISIYVIYNHLRRQMKELAHVATPRGEHVLEMDLSYQFPHEILAALQSAGFADAAVYGGYDHQPFDAAESEVLVYEARRPQGVNGHARPRS